MITVNPVYLHEFIGPLVGGADHEAEIISFSRFNIESKSDVKYLTEQYLIPYFIQQVPQIQDEAKKALAYYLSFNKIDFESVFNSLLLPLDTPINSRQFFLWLWEFFFPAKLTIL